MRLRDMISAALLPAFAQESRWLQVGFDDIVRPDVGRIKAIDAPLTMESIAALNDAELETLYRQYGIAEYYPDLTRETRNLMLYWASRLYRYLGTPKSVEILCNYIFDNNPISVVVHDNMAFDEAGNLIDPDLIDIFDVEVLPGDEYIAQDATKRILDNIIRFSRNSQVLRDVYYTLPDNPLDVTACIGLPCDGVGAVVVCDNDAVCIPVSTGIFFEIPQPTLSTFKKQTVFVEIPQPTLEKIIVSVHCSLYVIDEDGIIGIGGITYAYGYEFDGRKRVIEQSGVWVTQYQCLELWVGWETKTDAQLEEMGLSLSDPNKIIIGQTTSVESGITTLSSDYYWVYTFNATTTTNWYNSNNYATNPSPITTGSQETVGSSGTYVEAELSDGGGNVYSPETFRIDTYSDCPEIYFTPEVSPLDSGKCACLVKFNPLQYSTPFNLPSGLYTISGTTLTWDTSHPMYILLEGKEAYGS